MKNKAFTLVELLAVITLIGLLGLITVPIVNNALQSSREKAFKETLNAIIESVKIYNADSDYLAILDGESIDVLDPNITFENKSQIKSGSIIYHSGDYYFEYVASDYYCATEDNGSLEINDIDSEMCASIIP